MICPSQKGGLHGGCQRWDTRVHQHLGQSREHRTLTSHFSRDFYTGLTPGFGVLQLLVQTAGWAPGLP